MAVKVLIVDDSGFFRRRVVEILKGLQDIEVVGAASNGREAIDKAAALKPDVITMDYEMPVMDGITALKHIMESNPTPVLMFSSLTYEGARVTLDALDAGAVDFLPKSFEAMSGDAVKIKKLLHDRIMMAAGSRPRSRLSSTASVDTADKPKGPAIGSIVKSASRRGSVTPAAAASVRQQTLQSASQPCSVVRTSPAARVGAASRTACPAGSQHSAKPKGALAVSTVEVTNTPKATKLKRQDFSVVTIGTSTGGPVALQKVLTQLPAAFPKPIVLVQHMPATFTPAFAERLNKLSKIKVKQAEHGEVLKAGTAYIAPGGKQLLVERSGSQGRLKILEGDERLHYKPCVDVTFGSAAKVFPGKVLGIILTGMGADGREGCRMLKQSQSVVWSQDEQSSVIFGMPMAVIKAGLADQVFSLEEFSSRLVEGVG